MDQDDLLVEGCKAGNQQAQMEVYRKYYHRIYNTCLRIVSNSNDAEDLMQNSFIDAFNKIKYYKGPSAFAGWLKRIAVNNAIDHLARRSIHVENIDQLHDIAEYQDENEEMIELKVEQVKRAMNNLLTDYRVILSLNLFEGYDHEEIGQILKLSQANVRTRISRAKQALIKNINQTQARNGSMKTPFDRERKQS